MRYFYLAILFFLSNNSLAHGGHQHSSTKDNCTTISVQCSEALSLALTKDGHLWRTFVLDGHLYIQSQSDNGASFSDAVLVNPTKEAIVNKGEDRPQIAFGPKQEIYLVWARAGANFTGDIRFSRSINHGKSFSPPISINQEKTHTLHRFPVMKTRPDGLIFVAWIDGRLANQGHESAAIYYNWSNNQGQSFQTQDTQLSAIACQCCRLALDFNPQQQALVFYRDIFMDNQRDHSLATVARLGDAASIQRISQSHWQFNGCPHKGPSLLQQDETLHFIWFSKDRLYYQNKRGGQLSPAKAVGTAGSSHASLAFANGILYRSWQVFADGKMQVWLQQSTDHGASWQRAKRIWQTDQGSDYPSLVSNGKQVYLSWLSREHGHLLKALQP